MTEAQWLACKDPRKLLDYHRMKTDRRRLRLLAAACVRHAVTGDASPVVNEVIDVVERYADGVASRAEFLAARKAVRQAIKDKAPSASALKNLTDDEMEGMTVTIENVRSRSNGAHQCGLIRCLFPLRATSLGSSYFTANVVALASQMYESRDFSAMPILADALQDSGCDNDDVLNHCRGDGPHVRGCWVVDLVLGKE
jgi:hypothetical protein